MDQDSDVQVLEGSTTEKLDNDKFTLRALVL